MEDAQFDRLAQHLGVLRSRRAVTALLGGLLVSPVLAGPEGAAGKKKKKKCAKKCATGCCTSKFGKCLQPEQQSVSRCGTGGAVCTSTGCRECTAERPCPAGQCCSGRGTCGACLVFVTSTEKTAPNLGGLAGADGICQELARAAALPGRYLAWLSDSTASPSTRFTRATAPYTLVDGTNVADSWADLTSGTLNHAINRSESNTVIPGSFVWTHTLPDGTAGGSFPNSTCGNWTSAPSNSFGNSGSLKTTSAWTSGSASNCSLPIRLYCFQQP
ncbi:MAG: hypothetical protein U0075_13470 [Thermomicrobiales bacterium]